MSSQYGASQYKRNAVTTANRGELLIMLYEACIRHVKKAAVAIDKKDVSGKGAAIGKAHDILNELVTTLDFNVGGQIARDLERLYNFMIEQMVKANLENNRECLDQVAKLLETLLSGWREAVKQVNQGKAGIPAPGSGQ